MNLIFARKRKTNFTDAFLLIFLTFRNIKFKKNSGFETFWLLKWGMAAKSLGTTGLDAAIMWRVNLTNRVYHRRALSYWFRIIRNSLYLPSRPFFSSSHSIMWLCPFLIGMTDRRSAERKTEGMKGRTEILSLEYLCICECISWVGVNIPRFTPLYTHPAAPPIRPKWCIPSQFPKFPSKDRWPTWDLCQTVTTDAEDGWCISCDSTLFSLDISLVASYSSMASSQQ